MPQRSRGGRYAREIFIAPAVPAATIAPRQPIITGARTLAGGVLLARDVLAARSSSGASRIESIAGVDRYHLGAVTRRVLPRCHNPADGLADKKYIAACDRAAVYFELFSRLRTTADFNKLTDRRMRRLLRPFAAGASSDVLISRGPSGAYPKRASSHSDIPAKFVQQRKSSKSIFNFDINLISALL